MTGPSTRWRYGFVNRPSGSSLATDGLEGVPTRVAVSEGLVALEVHLPPVGSTSVGVHDPFHALEVGVVGRALVHVHGDVAGRAAVGRGQRDVVRGHHRTSTGKLSWMPDSSTRARTRFSASGTASRGMAYSIS